MLIAGKGNGPNLPEYLIEILYVLANLRQTKPEHLGELTRQNTQRVFNLNYSIDPSQ
jgi:Tat protein secretion system quality control protein TatD with DNase activity